MMERQSFRVFQVKEAKQVCAAIALHPAYPSHPSNLSQWILRQMIRLDHIPIRVVGEELHKAVGGQ